MSGIVAAFGNPKLSEIQQMQKTIKYRGKYTSGIFQKKDVILGQNYFEVDKGILMFLPAWQPVLLRTAYNLCTHTRHN